MRIVFMGTPAFAVPSLEALLASSHEVVGVVTQPDRPKGRGRSLEASPVKRLAQSQGLPILQPEKMKHPEFLESLSQWNPDLIVVTAFGRILPKVILELPPRGCINVHASLLPKYRGAAPIQWAIINGEVETGVTLMVMDEGMDTGSILLQASLSINPQETAGELGPRLARLGGAQLGKALKQLEEGTLIPKPQEEGQATLAPLLKKEDGLIRWTLTAEEIANRVRGMSPWPGCFTFLDQERLVIWRAEPLKVFNSPGVPDPVPGSIVEVNKGDLTVLTGHGCLKILEIQPANRKRMTVDQFLSGRSFRPGLRFSLQET